MKHDILTVNVTAICGHPSETSPLAETLTPT
jgi:hypothetical protein